MADVVGLVHVVDGGHVVVGLDVVDVTDVKVLKSSFNSTAWQSNELKIMKENFQSNANLNKNILKV